VDRCHVGERASRIIGEPEGSRAVPGADDVDPHDPDDDQPFGLFAHDDQPPAHDDHDPAGGDVGGDVEVTAMTHCLVKNCIAVRCRQR
jgi:hypothetical protein